MIEEKITENIQNVDQSNKVIINFQNLKYVKTKIEALCYLIWRDVTQRFNIKAIVEEIDPDFYIVSIGGIITIKIIQISKFIKIFCAKTPKNTIIDITLNIQSFFNGCRSNKITLEDSKIASTFLNYSMYHKILTIFDSRIYLTLQQETITQQLLQFQRNFIICMSVSPILFKVCKFLNKRDLLKFLTLNTHSVKNYANNKEFWFQLYGSKFGKTGFKLNQLEWKKVYLGKIK